MPYENHGVASAISAAHGCEQLLFDEVQKSVAAFVSLVGAPAIALVYGREFGASATILAIHIWASPFAFMAPVLDRSLILEDRAMLLMRRQIMAAIVNVALNLLLIPLYGAMGAAFASPEGQAVLADAPNFLDMNRLQVLAVEGEDIPLSTGTAAGPVG